MPVDRNRSDDWARTLFVAWADMVCWPIAIWFAVLVEAEPANHHRVGWLMVVAPLAQLLAGVATGLYRRRYRPASFEEVGAVALSVGVTGVALLIADLVLGTAGNFGHRCVLATATAVTLALGHRYARRMRSRRVHARRARGRMPVVVIGAGEGGYRAIKAMLSSTNSPYLPVALVDDDRTKRKVRIMGVSVAGTVSDIGRVAQQHHAQAVVIAIPSADVPALRRLHALASSVGLETLMLPSVQQLVGSGSTREIVRYTDEDVLRRKIVTVDLAAVRALVGGARVMVTGAGGSIGSELARQLAGLGPSHLVLVDHDDSLLHSVQQALLPTFTHLETELADVRDAARIHQIFARHRPNVVFHAAALKHVPALEAAPEEGWKTNVVGTYNVLTAAEASGVSHFVNISTDKAAEPVNVLGLTKRVAERLTASAAHRSGATYVSVRFGNVIGSRGSAIETFQAQIAAGGPVTVTDPHVTRYFMAIREAVRLTMQAATIARPAEVLVLDMGSPVAVLDVAKQLIEQSGHDIPILFTGLRPGEKLHEVLVARGETASRPHHPMIDHVAVEPIEFDPDAPFSLEMLRALEPGPNALYADPNESPATDGETAHQ